MQNSAEALAALSRCIAQHNQQGTFKSGNAAGPNATVDLLNANVLPHLSLPQTKVHFLAHLVGVLLNYLFTPAARRSMQYDNVGNTLLFCYHACFFPRIKDHMGNKRVDVCGPLLMQQVRNALFRMRGFVERGLAKGMTCRSQMALAVRELHQQPGRSMATIQAAIVSYFDSHTVRVYFTRAETNAPCT